MSSMHFAIWHAQVVDCGCHQTTPPWQTVYWWFRRFVRRLLFRTIHGVTLMLDREHEGREQSPTVGVMDSQSIKAPAAEKRGLMRAKKLPVVNGTLPSTPMFDCSWSI